MMNLKHFSNRLIQHTGTDDSDDHRGFGLLFWLLIINLLVTFSLADSEAGRMLAGVTITAVILSSIYSVSHNPKWMIIVLFSSLPALLNTWILHYYPLVFLETLNNILFVGAQMSITIYLLRSLLLIHQVKAGAIYAAMTVYVLIGQCWSYIYLIIHSIDPGAFTSASGFTGVTDGLLPDYLYYSFVTLTTLGFGDVTPISNVARVWTTLEAIVGQLYLTVVMARLMGIYLARRIEKKDS